MARPSKNTDQVLIQAARKLLPKVGSTGLNLRQVAAEANVNLGMFHYHFKTKDEFIRHVLQEIYDDFFEGFSLITTEIENPEQQLKQALEHLALFARENRTLIFSLLKDAINGDREVQKFIKENFGRHLGVMMRIITKGKKAGILDNVPTPVLMIHLVSTVGFPNLAVEMIERSAARKPLGLLMPALRKMLLGDSIIAWRIEKVMKALRPEVQSRGRS
jgi:AcrR family transcriptional regulator